jgi:pimeloyl-ACP methyl ester carboxylesterase
LISTVVPPAENALSALGSIPFALRIVFRFSKALTSVAGPTPIVSQYTDRSVSDSVAEAVAADFHEALRRDARAVERESRAFANALSAPTLPDVPVRVWHGTRDENTPLSPVRTLVRESEATLTTVEADHLGTLLDRQRDALVWIGADW